MFFKAQPRARGRTGRQKPDDTRRASSGWHFEERHSRVEPGLALSVIATGRCSPALYSTSPSWEAGSASCTKLETLCAVTSLPLPHLARRGTTAMGSAGGDTLLEASSVVPTQSTPSSRVRRSLGSWQCITTLSDKSLKMSTSHFVMFRERHVLDSAGLHWNGTSGSVNACAGRDDVAIQKLVGFLLVGTLCHHKQGGNAFARIATWQHEGLTGMHKVFPTHVLNGTSH